MAKPKETIKDYKEKLKKKELGSLTTELRKETKKIQKVKAELPTARYPKKTQLEIYRRTIQRKVNMVLRAMTKDKAQRANLAQLAKALRVLADKLTAAGGAPAKITEQRRVNINLNIKKMNKEELLDLLSKKSQQYEGDKE